MLKGYFGLYCSAVAVLCLVKSAPIMHRSPCIASNWCFNGAVCWRLQRVKRVSGWLLKAVMFHLAMNHVVGFWMDWQWRYGFSSAFIIKIQTESPVLCVIWTPTRQKKTDDYAFLRISLCYINITRCFVARNPFPSSYYVISSKHLFSWSAGQMSQQAEDVLHVTFNYFKFYQ